MEYFTLARVLHVLAVVLWIGGVSMVTTVIIPAVKRMNSKEEQIETFEKIEGRFAIQAKITTLITAITGFYMVYVLDAWYRFLEPRFWWFHAMVIVWVLFTVVLYILEPFVLHKLFKKYANKNPEKTFKIMHRAHWILLVLSLITIAGAVAGCHGWFLF
ncbi:hypothetical protein EC396_12535 [Lutibacter sp. HS1-25]|uniref:hypothetical protein n=1 Tax=Lutibacter sp. HS1-25 TaxID=2485000 RepID=UPI001013536D|nr:hypothetical protein [Lutibacter sp. HS1-25]RXP49320.1 hypothetical protein EC396_12535 [Lutibacter sp. HS1-25]